MRVLVTYIQYFEYVLLSYNFSRTSWRGVYLSSLLQCVARPAGGAAEGLGPPEHLQGLRRLPGLEAVPPPSIFETPVRS